MFWFLVYKIKIFVPTPFYLFETMVTPLFGIYYTRDRLTLFLMGRLIGSHLVSYYHSNPGNSITLLLDTNVGLRVSKYRYYLSLLISVNINSPQNGTVEKIEKIS